MAEEGTLAINADVLKKAGVNASSTSTAEAYTNIYIKMAEGQLSTSARYDWVANYSSVSAIGKQILKDAASSYAAILAMNYDPRNYTSSQEFSFQINIIWAGYQKVINLLEKDSNYKEFILSGAGDID